MAHTMAAKHIPTKLMAAFTDDKWPVAYMVTDDSVDVWLHGFVGDEYDAADSQTIGQVLATNRDKPVTLRVNSPGGLAYDGVAIYHAIDQHPQKTTGVIEGLAGSAASLAVIACDHVTCHVGAVFHPHYSLVIAFGHQPEIRDALAIQERLDLDMEVLYAQASGRSIEDVKKDLTGPNGDGTRFSAEQALAAGYVDEIIPANKNKQRAEAPTPAPDDNRKTMLQQKRLALLNSGRYISR